MKLCVSDVRAIESLRAYLGARTDYVVAEEEPGALRVGVLGSYRDGGRAELGLYLEGWRASNPTVEVAFADEAGARAVRFSPSARIGRRLPGPAALALAG